LTFSRYALLCTHINHPAQLCVPLPDGVTCEQGSFVEPLAVGLNAVRRAGVKAGQNVAILGAGPVGLAALGCAKALGAAKVLITDLAPSRLDAAKNAGADVTLNVSGMKPIDVATAVTDALKTGAAAGEASVGLGEVELGSMDAAVDCVVDCAGFSDTLTAATYMVKPGGTISVVGLGTSAPSFPLLAGAVKEVTINPAFAYGPTGYADALALIADGKVDVSKFISHRLKMDEAQRGFEMCFENKEGAVKVLFTTD
jgi:L-iditol 2-dehydrogenase